MKVLLFHGYLLRGTGSNVYNASLARTLAGLGHDVHLLCQDRRAAELDWVGSVGRFDGDRLEVEELRRPPAAGAVTAYLPDIGGLLPVFVHDRYEGFEVKTFPELGEAELDRYLKRNVAAVEAVIERIGGADAALANHLVMGPAVLARARLRYAIKVHGSDLSYTVMPHRERFVPFAREGTDGAAAVLVGSRHTAADLWSTVDDPGLPARTRLGPPGIDVAAFRPRPERVALAAVEALAARIGGAADAGFGRDGPAAAWALKRWVGGEPRVIFVGKLLVSKGADLLLAAWPLTVREHRGARLLVVGFGSYRAGLERLWSALAAGDIGGAREVARAGRALEDGEEKALAILSAFLDDPPPGYAQAGRAAADSVDLSGRLEHAEVAEVLPAADALVMPSTFPEAFGMVAVEAAACGALPVSAAHSGMVEVSRRLAAALPAEIAALLSFAVEPGAVAQLADRLRSWLDLPRSRRRELGAGLAGRAAELWSWERVAEGVIDASCGALDRLPGVTADDQ